MRKSDLLKQEILDSVVKYYSEIQDSRYTKESDKKNSRINYAGRVFDEKEMISLIDSALEFWLTSGRYSKEFEKSLAEYLGVRFALLVNSGSSANLLAFFALTSPLLKERQVQRGDEIITLAAGFPTTIAPIIQYGAVPVFVDIDKTLNINVADLDKALSRKTKAVMIAHTLGNPFDAVSVKAFCDRHNLWLIEDNCDALGSEYQGKKTGTFGDIGTSSFYPPHHITMGEGGAVYTNNPTLKKILLSMRDWGRDCWCESGVDNTCKARFSQQCGELPFGYDHKYVYSHFGFNLKATDLQAAIGCEQLKKLPNFVEKRIKNHNILYNALKNTHFLHLVEAQKDSKPSWFGFMMIVDEKAPFTRNEIVEYLESKHIQTRALFAGNMLKHPAFTHLQKGKDYRVVSDLTQTNAIMERGFWIGVYPGLAKQELVYVAQSICSFVDMYKNKTSISTISMDSNNF
ncbi:lipopolysaccharide biosynthesis protein RfbH [Helicobacter cinaedi]|uniref:lipopolysaccharide biosynthesis protein RfbH n=1 Tax=Helicobacter cinaedi TaxID=213 RepID=UPI001EED4963|nr:lipopolysaccharide biosynthesis protein RfbH [Helicobacter cinaedi]BDB67085.1 lipopolysaccharide biosynthesis protein RfbH [Helicobacter cinaedi]